ncbi:MAG: hypothetical protein KDA75_08470 [Planctomycetaceae bacterium]|nr:hypothetical protein [Planctomycetaceae bacterium]
MNSAHSQRRTAKRQPPRRIKREPAPSTEGESLRQTLQNIADLLTAREEDFDALRQLQLEWLQFQTTLDRLVHLIDGNGHPPIAERILLLEEQARRLNQVGEQIEAVKFRLIGLLVGLTISLIATLFTLLR